MKKSEKYIIEDDFLENSKINLKNMRQAKTKSLIDLNFKNGLLFILLSLFLIISSFNLNKINDKYEKNIESYFSDKTHLVGNTQDNNNEQLVLLSKKGKVESPVVLNIINERLTAEKILFGTLAVFLFFISSTCFLAEKEHKNNFCHYDEVKKGYDESNVEFFTIKKNNGKKSVYEQFTFYLLTLMTMGIFISKYNNDVVFNNLIEFTNEGYYFYLLLSLGLYLFVYGSLLMVKAFLSCDKELSEIDLEITKLRCEAEQKRLNKIEQIIKSDEGLMSFLNSLLLKYSNDPDAYSVIKLSSLKKEDKEMEQLIKEFKKNRGDIVKYCYKETH